MALLDFVNNVLGEKEGGNKLKQKLDEVLVAVEVGKTSYGSVNKDITMGLNDPKLLANLIDQTRSYLSEEKAGIFSTVITEWLEQNASRITVVREKKSSPQAAPSNPSIAPTVELQLEKLANTFEGSLYEPATLQRVREQFDGKKVVVIDLDGVIRGYKDGNSINEQALAAMDKLSAEGCVLVLWTAAKIDSTYFRKYNLGGRFSLIIEGENFDKRFTDKNLFLAAISNTPWLSADEKDMLSSEFLKYDGVKPIPIIFANCSVVEDSITVLPEHFRQESTNYNFIYTPTFNGVREDYDPSECFGIRHVEDILHGTVNDLRGYQLKKF